MCSGIVTPNCFTLTTARRLFYKMHTMDADVLEKRSTSVAAMLSTRFSRNNLVSVSHWWKGCIYRPNQWRHNEHDSVSDHQPHHCLLNRLFRSFTDQRKHKSSASLAFVRGIQRWPANSPNKGLVTRKMFPFEGVIMRRIHRQGGWNHHDCEHS